MGLLGMHGRNRPISGENIMFIIANQQTLKCSCGTVASFQTRYGMRISFIELDTHQDHHLPIQLARGKRVSGGLGL